MAAGCDVRCEPDEQSVARRLQGGGVGRALPALLELRPEHGHRADRRLDAVDEPVRLPAGRAVPLHAVLRGDVAALPLAGGAVVHPVRAVLARAAAVTKLHLGRDRSGHGGDGHVVLRLRVLQHIGHARAWSHHHRRLCEHGEEDSVAAACSRRLARLRRRAPYPGQRGEARAAARRGVLYLLDDPRHRLEHLADHGHLSASAAPLHPAGRVPGRDVLLVDLLGALAHALAAHEPEAIGQAHALPPLLVRAHSLDRALRPVGHVADGGHHHQLSRRPMGLAVDLRRVLARAVRGHPHGHCLLVEPKQEQPPVRVRRRAAAGR
mmetsp:Transcript_8248/g.21299  ORF Transcript_8248/g.21299 Transcript_8248/m.21299 type:complete len:322 (-) Transcript_8248:369-1334(-)